MSTMDSSSDSVMLAWGSSVNVVEDLRRSLRSDVDDIDAYVKNTLQPQIAREDAAAAQLRRDLAHSDAEMSQQCREAGERREEVVVRGQLFAQMRRQMVSELAAVVSPPSSPDPHVSASDDGTEAMQIDNGDGNCAVDGSDAGRGDGDQTGVPSPTCIKAKLASNQEEIRNLTRLAEEDRDEIAKLQAQLEDTHRSAESLHEILTSEETERTRRHWENEAQQRQAEVDDERARIRALKEKLDRSRYVQAETAQKITEKTKLLTSTKNENDRVENVRADAIMKCEAEIAQMKSNDLRDLEDTLQTHTEELATLIDQFAAVDQIRKSSEENRAKLQAVNIATETLRLHAENADEDLRDSRDILTNALDGLRDAQASEAELAAFKKQNDEREESELRKAREEKDGLVKEKARLAAIVAELNARSLEEAEAERIAREEREGRLKNMELEEKALQEELAGLEAELADLIKSTEEDKLEAEREVAAHESIRINLEKAIEAAGAEKESVLEHRAKEQARKVTRLKREGELMATSLRFELETLEKGAAMLESSNKAIEKLRNAPIIVEEEMDGDDETSCAGETPTQLASVNRDDDASRNEEGDQEEEGSDKEEVDDEEFFDARDEERRSLAASDLASDGKSVHGRDEEECEGEDEQPIGHETEDSSSHPHCSPPGEENAES